jgi:hypothetical protein
VSRVSSGRGSGWADGGILLRGRGELADIKARDAGRGAAGRKERVSAIRQAVRSGGGRRQEASRTNAGTIVETPPKYRIDSRPHLLALSYSQFSWARPRPVKFTRNPGDDLSPLLPASSLPVFLSPLPSLSLSLTLVAFLISGRVTRVGACAPAAEASIPREKVSPTRLHDRQPSVRATRARDINSRGSRIRRIASWKMIFIEGNLYFKLRPLPGMPAALQLQRPVKGV